MLAARGCGEMSIAFAWILRSATGRNPQLDLGSGEPLDDLHGPATFGAGPHGGSGLGLGASWKGAVGCSGGSQRAETNRQQGGALAGGQKPKVPDAHKALGEQVQQEAAQKLLHWQGHQALFVLMCGVSPTEGDLIIGERDQSMVGYSHPVRITAEVTKHMLRAAKGTFRVDHPIVAK